MVEILEDLGRYPKEAERHSRVEIHVKRGEDKEGRHVLEGTKSGRDANWS